MPPAHRSFQQFLAARGLLSSSWHQVNVVPLLRDAWQSATEIALTGDAARPGFRPLLDVSSRNLAGGGEQSPSPALFDDDATRALR